jgi:hypothetical protein
MRAICEQQTHPGKAMIEYRGYLILGTALMVHPNSPDWRAVGIVCRETLEGLIIQIERTGGPVFTTKGGSRTRWAGAVQEVGRRTTKIKSGAGRKPTEILH